MLSSRSHSTPVSPLKVVPKVRRNLDFELFSSASSSPPLHPDSGASTPHYCGRTRIDVTEATVLDHAYARSLHRPAASYITSVLLPALASGDLKTDLTHHPFELCQHTALDLDRARMECNRLYNRMGNQPVIYDRAALVTSIISVVDRSRILADAQLRIPVLDIYIGAQVMGQTNLDTGGPVSKGLQIRRITLETQLAWRLPTHTCSGFAMPGQTAEQMQQICRALMVPPRKVQVKLGTYTTEKLATLPYNYGQFITFWQLRLDVLLSCLDQVPARDDTEVNRVRRAAFNLATGSLAALDKIRTIRPVVEKYSHMIVAGTIEEARALRDCGALSQRDVDDLSDHDLLLEFKATAHDGIAGTLPGFAHVVSHMSGDAVSDELRADIKRWTGEQPDEGVVAYRKPGSRTSTSSSSRSSATSSPRFGPASSALRPARRSDVDRHGEHISQLRQALDDALDQ